MTPAPISVERLKEVVRFLCGEGELDGYTFGEGPVVGKVTRRYWWRAKLVEAVSVVPALLHQLAEKEAEVERLRTQHSRMVAEAAESYSKATAAERAREEATGLLRDCDTVANVRGMLGVPDCIDNNGQPYQSAHLAAFLAASGGKDNG